jgi:lactoylglutathione lyase
MEIRHIDHVTLFVSDLARSLEFYTGTVGLHLAYEGTLGGGIYGAFLDVGETMINVIEDRSLAGLIPHQHIAMSVDDVDAVYAQLSRKGLKFDQPEPENLPSGYITGQRYIEFRDPDGVRIEIVQRSADYYREHAEKYRVTWQD